MSRIIKGQAWIHENTSLVQDMTIVYDNGRRVSCPAQILISDIWSDLDKATGNEWKRLDVDSSFFYWEYEYTNLETFVDEVTKFECPKPTKEYYDEKFPNIDPKDWDLSTLDSDWAKYWAGLVKISNINYSNLSVWKDTSTSLGGVPNVNDWSGVGRLKFGTTQDRPDFPIGSGQGFQYFDTTIDKPIWWTGSKWVNATGSTV